MRGWKMVAARRAAARIVDTLTGTDRFAVLCFDHVVEELPDVPGGLAEATDRNRFRAIEWLARTDARGGTEMLGPLERAVRLLAGADPGRDRVLVLVTDGQVGNEDQILQRIGAQLAGIRVHVVGVDQAAGAGFLSRLAGAGRGRCELVESEDRLDEAAARIHRRIGAPLVTGLALAADGVAIVPGTVAPGLLPDLFPGFRSRWRGAGGGIPAGRSRWQAPGRTARRSRARSPRSPAATRRAPRPGPALTCATWRIATPACPATTPPSWPAWNSRSPTSRCATACCAGSPPSWPRIRGSSRTGRGRTG